MIRSIRTRLASSPLVLASEISDVGDLSSPRRTRWRIVSRTVLATAAGAVIASLGIVQAGAAGPPPTATGTFTFATDNVTLTHTADGNAFYSEVATGYYQGDLTGFWTDTDTYVVFKDGSFQAQGTELCTGCTLGGRTGSFNSVWEAGGSGSGVVGHLTFTGGGGGLSGLQGEGTFQNFPTVNVYSYVYHFDS
jgi:hypothetical protein